MNLKIKIGSLRAIFALVVSGILLTALPHFANGAESSQLAEGSQALLEGIPQVAAQKLRAYLAANPGAPDADYATLKLVNALVQMAQYDDAFALLKKFANGKNPRADFLKAQACAALGDWHSAASLYQSASRDSSFANAAALGEAEALHQLGKTANAIRVLEAQPNLDDVAKLRLADFYLDENALQKAKMVVSGLQLQSAFARKWQQYLNARLALANGDAKKASDGFQASLKVSKGTSDGLLAAATIGVANAEAKLAGNEKADDFLEAYIWQHPHSAFLDQMFARLDEIYDAEENPSDLELQKWAQQKEKRRAAHALYYLAKLQFHGNKTDAALKNLDAFFKKFPESPLIANANFLRGKILLANGQPEPAIAAFEMAMRHATDADQRAAIEMMTGAAHFQQRDFVTAGNLFRDAAEHSEKLQSAAWFNAALAWIQQGNDEAFREDSAKLAAVSPGGSLTTSLLLEKGLVEARQKNPSARETLLNFVRDFPDHPRAGEARLALAELAYKASPRDLPTAHAYIAAALKTSANPQIDEQSEYLAIFVADAAKSPNDQNVIALCRKFIAAHSASKLLPEVRMKLGQVYFRIKDFANAGAQFETLVNDFPGSPLAESALFLAGRSATEMHATDHALDLFEQAAKYNGTLKLYAREEQARIEYLSGAADKAAVIYDNILSAQPPPDSRLRFAALCGKADSLNALGVKDPKYFAQARVAYDELAKSPDVTPYWRDEALYKKGVSFEKENRVDDALAAFYDVLEAQQADAKSTEPPEFFWYYKAGFDAGQILETQKQWKAAVAIYRKIAALPGPRQQEAEERARQLQLKHFVWDE